MIGRRFLRGGLYLLALIQGGLGLYAYAFPLPFYHGLPFPGHSWVDLLPPYNEHLVTDYGILSLSLAVILAAAGIFLERRLAQSALGGYLVYGVLHLTFHVTHLENFSPADAILQTLAMILLTGLTIGLLVLTPKARARMSLPSTRNHLTPSSDGVLGEPADGAIPGTSTPRLER